MTGSSEFIFIDSIFSENRFIIARTGALSFLSADKRKIDVTHFALQNIVLCSKFGDYFQLSIQSGSGCLWLVLSA